MKPFLCFFLFQFLFFCPYSNAQKKPSKYWVEFTDKENTPYSIFQPYEYLSFRAIERRAKQNIPIVQNDLPVDPNYLEAVKNSGAKIHNVSKWLNATSIIADSLTLSRIKKLPFVQQVIFAGGHSDKLSSSKQEKKVRDLNTDYEKSKYYYGGGHQQIVLLNGQTLHQRGWRGDGKLIAILDGGFTNVDIMPFFDSLRLRKKILQGWDFVDRDDSVYESSNHGSGVLSTMGSNLPGLLVGTAPEAMYICLKTEDTRSEYLIEECNWIVGAEFADSLGVDVINSSLGYTTFWDKRMDYKFEDLNGKTSISSRGAEIAFSKGILIVNSAGNSGNSPDKHVGVPADAPHVMSIGATDAYGRKASFSSIGPNANGRIKPDISAMGQMIIVGSTDGYQIKRSNGTSFSSPIITGMVASLWAAFPNSSNEEIYDAVLKSSHLATNPDNQLGYGIPDFYKAFQILKNTKKLKEVSEGSIDFYYDENEIVLFFPKKETGEIMVELVDILGQSHFSENYNFSEKTFSLKIKDLDLLPDFYFLKVFVDGAYYFGKL